MEINATKLRAAAPDLLNACYAILRWSELGGDLDEAGKDRLDRAMGKVRRALAKAGVK